MIEWAKKYVGIPYKLNKRNMEECDCYGLLWLIYKNEYDISLPIFDDEYDENSTREDVLKIFVENIERWKEIKDVKVGDAVYFRVGGLEKHVGVMVSSKMFIHNFKEGGSVAISDLSNVRWKNRIVGFYRYE